MFLNDYQQNRRIYNNQKKKDKKTFQGSKGKVGEKSIAEDYGFFSKPYLLIKPQSGIT